MVHDVNSAWRQRLLRILLAVLRHGVGEAEGDTVACRSGQAYRVASFTMTNSQEAQHGLVRSAFIFSVGRSPLSEHPPSRPYL